MRIGTKKRTETQHNIPKLLPDAANPVANAFFLEKYVAMIATLGTNKQPQPTPTHTACASMTSQYLVQILVIIIPKTTRNEPANSKCRKYPASKSGPVATPTRRRR
jgi:hypothetical protein